MRDTEQEIGQWVAEQITLLQGRSIAKAEQLLKVFETLSTPSWDDCYVALVKAKVHEIAGVMEAMRTRFISRSWHDKKNHRQVIKYDTPRMDAAWRYCLEYLGQFARQEGGMKLASEEEIQKCKSYLQKHS